MNRLLRLDREIHWSAPDFGNTLHRIDVHVWTTALLLPDSSTRRASPADAEAPR